MEFRRRKNIFTHRRPTIMAEATESGDWRPKYGVTERWSEARRRKMLTDVEFTVGEGESVRGFAAHKNVLAFSSPVFEAMFFGTIAETKNTVAIVDIDPLAFETLLKFAYGETVSFTSITNAAKVHAAADKYLMADLRAKACEHICKAPMDDPQFWELILQDRFFMIPVVRQKCLEYIAQHATTLFKSYLFVNISYNVMQVILQMEKINISEYELLSAVVRWGIGNLKNKQSLKTRLESLLPHIRFSVMTVDEYCNFSDCHPGLLDAEDSLAIMKHLHKPSVYKLPAWCTISSKKRI